MKLELPTKAYKADTRSKKGKFHLQDQRNTGDLFYSPCKFFLDPESETDITELDEEQLCKKCFCAFPRGAK